MHAEQVTDPVAEHGEGPVWSPAWGGLKFVDMLAGDVLSLGEDDTVTRVHVGPVAAALRPRTGGGAVLGLERSFALASRDDLSDATALPPVWTDPTVRFNDGGCDPQGRFYCGTMAYDEAPGRGTMYRLGTVGTDRTRDAVEDVEGDGPRRNRTGGLDVEAVWGNVTISNGFAFSPDGRLAYYNDTPTRRTDVFDYDDERGFSGRRALMRLDVKDAGNPDGLCVDADGGIWTALWGGSAVRRYTPGGRLDGVVELPVTHVTACTFGGDDLSTLYITTSRTGIPRGEQPEAGALFAVRPGVAGQPVLPYDG